ncbi:Hint domain-containing protein [Acidisoma cellulosilytica]|uniref:Hint domain-containing protein n=1 Tax=Acidisoma cellulosilyticum TaxID=2802395 RepID=A0A963YZ57_9PROT|nr:Hint domain-containing protein [Acidisoma cellulosilyticum]MCB8879596.1 Hint domain-containing protein [Acidisoma cellulosilyticum]
MSSTVERAADFIGSIGVNTRLEYTDGTYAKTQTVIDDLAYLGISNVRDSIAEETGGTAPLQSYETLAAAGIKFTIEPFSGGDVTDASITAALDLIDQLEASYPGSVIAVEGANEVNNFPLTFDGISGLDGAVALQEALYADVKNDPTLTGVAVDYFTGYNAGSIGVGPDPYLEPGLADNDTQHPYPNNGEPPYLAVTPIIALGNEVLGIGPAVYTETGYSTNGGTTGDVNQDVQAKYTLDLLMDDAKNGIAETYLYQLLDAYAPGSSQGDSGYGLFDYTGQPKEAAVGIHNLTTILADTGANAASFTPTYLTYALFDLPLTGNSLELQKSDGATDIVVWNEPAIWDELTGAEITAPTTTVTVDLGTSYQTVEVFDPLAENTLLETLHNVSSVALGITDHPLIVEVEPDSVACFARGTHLRTDRGDVAVEHLVVGDLVETIGGVFRPITWIGSRRIDCARHRAPDKILPVRITAGAFGEGLPERDLVLSPDHAVFAEDVLIPVKHLINGTSVRQETVAVLTYFHIALADHDVLLAEGLPTESYLDTGDSLSFGEGRVVNLHPAWGEDARDLAFVRDALAYAPLRVDGDAVHRLRARLHDNCGLTATPKTMRAG